MSSYEKIPLVRDKYPIFEWAPCIPKIYETQEKVLDIINEDELEVEDVAINDDDNGKEEDEDEWVLNIMEENPDPVNEESVYIIE